LFVQIINSKVLSGDNLLHYPAFYLEIMKEHAF